MPTCGRRRRFCAAQSACTKRYPRVFNQLRRTSRDTTDGERSICAAITRIDHPAFNPCAISTLSATLEIPYQRLRRLEIGTRGDTKLEQQAHQALDQISSRKAA